MPILPEKKHEMNHKNVDEEGMNKVHHKNIRKRERELEKKGHIS
jgi:predicted metal-dependent TIM-barrel fold hydrolase